MADELLKAYVDEFKAAVDEFLERVMFKTDLEECADRADADEAMFGGVEEEDFSVESNRCSMCGCILANGELDSCDLCGCGGF